MPVESHKKTPLYNLHVQLGARIVDFGGWDMPVQYSGILDETRAVRRSAGAFDVSHMARVIVQGPGAPEFLQYVTTNDISQLSDGQAQYSLITQDNGGIVDDILVYRIADKQYQIVLNASNMDKDIQWLAARLPVDAHMDNETARTVMIAVQGPQAAKALASIMGIQVIEQPRFTRCLYTWNGVSISAARTGYTGEDGFEVIVPSENGVLFWSSLMDCGVTPCGLGARDTLRVEAGFPLYGHEIDGNTLPVEAGLMWAVKLQKGSFIGDQAIKNRVATGAKERLVGIVLHERLIPRPGYIIYSADKPIGRITSGVYSPTMGCGLGMAYVDTDIYKDGLTVELEIRGKRVPVVLCPKKSLLKIRNEA